MHPVLFKVPLLGWEVYSFGVLLGLSLLVGWFLVHRLAARQGFPRNTVADGFVLTVVGGLLGARLQYVLTNMEEFGNPIAVLRITEGGLAAYGGLLGGVVVSWLYMRRKKLSTLLWLDMLVPAVAIGVILTRIGCFLHGCDFGLVAEKLAWGVEFPAGTPVFAEHLKQRLVMDWAEWSQPVYPVQLYWVVAGLVILALTAVAWRVRRFAGQVFLLATVAYAGATFGTELFRGDPDRGWLWMWSASQVIAAATTVAAVVLYAVRRRACRRDPAQAFCIGSGIDAALEAEAPSEVRHDDRGGGA